MDPFGIISIANSFNELMTFQLVNLNNSYPFILNQLMNASSIFTYDFLPNPLNIFSNIIIDSDSSLFVNNIPNHNSLSGPSFLYNILQLFPPICGLIFIFLINSIIIHSGYITRSFRFKTNFSNYIIYLRQSIFYQISIAAFSSMFYDSNKIDIIEFISYILGFIFLTCQMVLTIFFIFFLNLRKKLLYLPFIEDYFGGLYEGVEIESLSIYANEINTLKIQIVIYLMFIFQEYPFLQIILTIFIYTSSLLYNMLFRPFENFLDLLQSLIRESLFLAIGIMFLVYKIMMQTNKDLFNYQVILFFLFISILLNEFLFTILNYIYFFVYSCKENSVRNRMCIETTFEHLEIERVRFILSLLT